MAAGEIDFSHHALADPLRIVAFHHPPDELMPGNAVKSRIAFQNFAVGAADARQQNLDQGLARSALRRGHVTHRKFAVEVEGFHMKGCQLSVVRQTGFAGPGSIADN